MRVLIATDNYYPPNVNGSAYFTHRLAHSLAAAGHDVAVVAPSQSLAHTEESHGKITFFGVRSYPVFFYPPFRFVLPFSTLLNRRTRAVLVKFKPDIVHIQMHFPISRSTLMMARKRGIPVIATNHFMPENLTHYLHLPRSLTNAINRFMWRDAGRVLTKAHVVTAPTRTAAAMVQPWIPTTVPIVSNGIHLTRFSPAVDPTPARERYGIGSKPVFLFVGRLDKEKNVDVVLRAAALAKEQCAFQLIIAGKGAEQERLKKLAHTLGVEEQTVFTGFVPDELLPHLYAAADCFVNACTAELQCIALMEAMATGKAALGAHAVALPELIHDGENGYLFEPFDAAALAVRIVELAQDSAAMERMGKKSLEIIAGHDINVTLEQFEEFYRKALMSTTL